MALGAESTETATLEPASSAAPSARQRWRVRAPRAARVVVAAGAVPVLVANFRPWQGGLVEEWGLAQAWLGSGFAAYPASWSFTLGRPLHLLPAYLALELSRGSLVGIYAAMTLAALTQYVLAWWSLSRTSATATLRVVLALAVALHPWWPAGYTLRYLPAQFAIAFALLWFGATVRFLREGRARWLAVAAVGLLAALALYQAPAGAVVLGLVALAAVRPWPRARIAASGAVTAGAILASVAWALVLAPRITATYEQALAANQEISVVAAAAGVVRTAASDARGVVLLMGVAVVVAISLGFSQAVAQARAWVLMAFVGAAPAAALVFYPSVFHLQSPEHVQMTSGLAAWLVLAAVSTVLEARFRVGAAAQVVLVAGTAAGALNAYTYWADLSVAQQSLLDDVARVRPDVPPGGRLVVVDRTGHYGSLYLFLPPYLDIATNVEEGPGAQTVLCTPADVPRQPGVATDDCAAYLSPAALLLGEGTTVYGPVDLYSVPG